MTFLTRITIATRLRIGFALFLLPVILLCTAIYSDSAEATKAARNEKQGVRYITAVFALQDAMLQDSTNAKGAEMAAKLIAADDEFGSGLGVSDKVHHIAGLLKGSDAAGAVEARAALPELIVKIADGSGLTLDPALDTFYLMDTVVNHLVVISETLAELGAMAGNYAGKTTLTPDMQVAFLLLENRVTLNLEDARSGLATATKADTSGRIARATGDLANEAAGRITSTMTTVRRAVLTDRDTSSAAAQSIAASQAALVRWRDSSVTELSAKLLQRMDELTTKLWTLVTAAAALFTFSAAFIGFAVEGNGVRPLRRITEMMLALASGDLSFDIPGVERKDEVGAMARAMIVFRENARQAEALRDGAEKVRVAKDRRQAAMDRHTDDFGTSVAGVMASLSDAAKAMRQRANDMAGAVERTQGLAGETAEGATTSAQNLSTVAAAAEEMSASISEIGQQVARAAEAVRVTVDRATLTDTKVGGLAAAADKVGNVVRLITEIAGQTNLLALNATIEAARAGDAGKGFAVVAGEVKALAAQTARATEEIGAQIAAIRIATTEAVGAVRDVGTAIGEVDQVASAIAAAVEQQAAVTRDIVASVQTVTSATQQATQAMQDVFGMSETAAAASKGVLTGADEVGSTADVLRTEVAHFLTAMARTDENERRRYERIGGNGITVALTAPGTPDAQATIRDISRGGIAIECDVPLRPGQEVRVRLPGPPTDVSARVVRGDGRVIGLAFRQDDATLNRVDEAMDIIGQASPRKAA